MKKLALIISFIAITAGVYAYTSSSDDCCYEGSPCCYEGSPCCE